MRRNAIVTAKDILVDEQDSALLSSLRLDHEAALIELQETERGLEDANEFTELFSPNSQSEVLDQNSSSIAVISQSISTIPEDLSFIELRQEIESLRSSRTSFYTSRSMSDSASRHSKRLSQLLVRDENWILRRWSRTLSEPRLSYATLGRGSRASMLSPLAERPDLAVQESAKHPVKALKGNIMAIQDFYNERNADSYCFSCFDLLEFSQDKTCREVQEALFQRYDLGDCPGDYQARLIAVRDGTSLELCWDQSPTPIIKQFTRKGQSCSIVFYRAPIYTCIGCSLLSC